MSGTFLTVEEAVDQLRAVGISDLDAAKIIEQKFNDGRILQNRVTNIVHDWLIGNTISPPSPPVQQGGDEPGNYINITPNPEMADFQQANVGGPDTDVIMVFDKEWHELWATFGQGFDLGGNYLAEIKRPPPTAVLIDTDFSTDTTGEFTSAAERRWNAENQTMEWERMSSGDWNLRLTNNPPADCLMRVKFRARANNTITGLLSWLPNQEPWMYSDHVIDSEWKWFELFGFTTSGAANHLYFILQSPPVGTIIEFSDYYCEYWLADTVALGDWEEARDSIEEFPTMPDPKYRDGNCMMLAEPTGGLFGRDFSLYSRQAYDPARLVPGTDSFTLEFMLYIPTDAGSAIQRFFNFADSEPGINKIEVNWDGTQDAIRTTWLINGDQFALNQFIRNFPKGQWNHLIMSFDRSVGVDVWINGVYYTTFGSADARDWQFPTSELTFGGNYGRTGVFPQDNLGFARFGFYRRAFKRDEVLKYYGVANGLTPVGAPDWLENRGWMQFCRASVPSDGLRGDLITGNGVNHRIGLTIDSLIGSWAVEIRNGANDLVASGVTSDPNRHSLVFDFVGDGTNHTATLLAQGAGDEITIDTWFYFIEVT